MYKMKPSMEQMKLFVFLAYLTEKIFLGTSFQIKWGVISITKKRNEISDEIERL